MPSETSPPAPLLKERGELWQNVSEAFPLSRLGGGRWERGPGGEASKATPPHSPAHPEPHPLFLHNAANTNTTPAAKAIPITFPDDSSSRFRNRDSPFFISI